MQFAITKKSLSAGPCWVPPYTSLYCNTMSRITYFRLQVGRWACHATHSKISLWRVKVDTLIIFLSSCNKQCAYHTLIRYKSHRNGGLMHPLIILTLLLPRSSIDDLVFSVFTSNFVKLCYKISLLKNRFVTLFFIRFS